MSDQSVVEPAGPAPPNRRSAGSAAGRWRWSMREKRDRTEPTGAERHGAQKLEVHAPLQMNTPASSSLYTGRET